MAARIADGRISRGRVLRGEVRLYHFAPPDKKRPALVLTRNSAIAYLSTVTVAPETIVQFEGDLLILEHGSLQVNTWRGMRVRENCVTVSPPAQEWARYDVTDVDGTVLVLAHQNDVRIHYSGPTTWRSKHVESANVTVYQGGQATHEDRCGEAPKPFSPESSPGWLNTPWAVGIGGAVVVGVTCWALCREHPMSPDGP